MLNQREYIIKFKFPYTFLLSEMIIRKYFFSVDIQIN